MNTLDFTPEMIRRIEAHVRRADCDYFDRNPHTTVRLRMAVPFESPMIDTESVLVLRAATGYHLRMPVTEALVRWFESLPSQHEILDQAA